MSMFQALLDKLVNLCKCDNTPEKFLKLTKKCLDLVEGRPWMVSRVTFTPYVYNGQCKYLINKLRDVVESAQAFLIVFNKGSLASKASLHCLEVFKHLYDLANVVKHFIQSCCHHASVQTTVCLSDVSEQITSLGFNLEIMRLTFLKRLYLSMIDVVYEVEVEIVTEKAITDRELLLKEVSALLETQKSTSPYYQLATCVHERLQLSLTPPQIGLPESHCIDEKCLKQTVQLGRGASATVYRASWLGMEVAKKTFLGGASPEFEKEVSILLRLSHPNITSLIGYAQGYWKCSIIMELMDEDLHTLIQKRTKENKDRGPPFGMFEALDIMLQIRGGMRYLRKRRIVHRDLKSMNILVKHVKTEGSRGYVLAKLSNFGLSKTKEKSSTFSNQTLNIGTTRWMAQELIKLRITEEQSEVSKAHVEIAKYPYSYDVYSFAMVCYEILTGEILFLEEGSLSAVKEKVLKGDRPKLPNLCHPRLKRLIEQCWSSDPSTRPTFIEIFVEMRCLKCLFLAPPLPAYPLEVVKYDWSQISLMCRDFTDFYNHGMLANGQEVFVVTAIAQGEDSFINTIEFFQKRRHRNFVPLVGYCNNGRQALVYEYMPLGTLQGNLYGKIKKEFFLNWKARLDVALSCAEGLDYLYSCNPQLAQFGIDSSRIYKLEAKFLYLGGFRRDFNVPCLGSVMLELISARPSTFDLAERTRYLLHVGKLEEIVDSLLSGQYNMGSMHTTWVPCGRWRSWA